MKSKYFKLKLTLLTSIILIIIGLSGSVLLINLMKNSINKEIIKGNVYETVELLKTDKKISYIDLTKYYEGNIELEKSDDGYNHIILKKRKKAHNFHAEFDEKNNELVLLKLNSEPNEKDKLVDLFENLITRRIIRGELFGTIYNDIKIDDLTTITIKVKEPIELYCDNMLNNSKNFDVSMVKNTIDYRNVKSYFNFFNLSFKEIPFDNIVVNNFNYQYLKLRESNLREITVNVDKIENLVISEDGIYNQNKLRKLIVNCENVENVVLDLSNLDNNIDIIKAKNVVIENKPKESDYNIKYYIEGEEKLIKYDRLNSDGSIRINSLNIEANSIKVKNKEKVKETSSYTTIK